MPLPVVAIVGRPNVGKSTLFNRVVGFQKAVVHDRPGVTRDRLYETTEFAERSFLIIDTGGLEPAPDTDLLHAMRRQAVVAMEEADVIVFVVDGRLGFTPADAEVAELLRRTDKQVVLAVNKVDGPGQEDLTAEFWQVGLERMFTVSAEHGRGVYELMAEVVELLPEHEPEAEPEEDGSIRIAVIGRPNIGKSTLINHLLGEDRHVVHDAPGTTMDPVDSVLEVDGQRYVLVDTAGVRRKARISDGLERFISLRSIRAIERCHVSVLMVDATIGITDQDAKLAQLVEGRGRALILLFNKWDLVKDLEHVDSGTVEDDIERKLPHASWAPYLFTSAKTGKGLHRVLPTVRKVYAEFDKRVSTSQLNRFLEGALVAHTPPQRHHHPVRIYYMTQNRVRPPTFAFFCNTPEGVGPTYQRYLQRRLRESFGFEGTPLRMKFRKRRKLGEPKDG